MEIPNWLKEWAMPGATFLLALAAFWAIWQNYRVRKEDRQRILKTRALRVVRDWVNEATELMILNAKYSDECRSKDLPKMRKTLEDIQSAKMELIKMSEDVFSSARLFGSDLFSPVDKAYQTLIEFVKEGMAEKTDIDKQYRHNFVREFANIL